MMMKINQALLALSQILTTPLTVLLQHLLSPRSDVFRLSLRDLPDAVLGCGAGRLSPPNAPPRRDEVGVATGVREGIGGAAGTSATLEG